MTTAEPSVVRTPVKTLSRYIDVLNEAMKRLSLEATAAEQFAPAWALPTDHPRFDEFVSVAAMSVAGLGSVDGVQFQLLNMMHNPATRTTKTFASLVIVGRAIEHHRVTGEPVMIVTPSSANKATALRDAVLRAYEVGLATPASLRIVSLVPGQSVSKLWASKLSEDETLRRQNPLLLLDTDQPGSVKSVAAEAYGLVAERFFAVTGFRLWHSMDVRNYMAADALRSAFEHDALGDNPMRVHAHAVSSAFGLLGHHFGQEILGERFERPLRAQYLLVQHLGAPDMVASLHHGNFDHRPGWSFQDGLFRQTDPHFPYATNDPSESLDITFYTRRPATSAQMNQIIGANGGAGIVVSMYECLTRYNEVRALLAGGGHELPADPRELREWSLVMATTGALNAVERGLVEGDDVLIHGSGSYSINDFEPIDANQLTVTTTAGEVANRMLDAAR